MLKRIRRTGGFSALNTLYSEARLPQDVRRSLNLMLTANLFGTLFGIICGSGTTAMIGLANQLKAGDLAFGVINSIPQVACMLQIPFSLLVSCTHKRKRYLMTLGMFSRMLWILFGFIPLIVPTPPEWLPLWTLIFLLGVSSCCGAVINVCWFPWFSDLAPIGIRGRWFSVRDTILAGVSLVFGILVARLLDTLPAESRYIIVFTIGGVFGMLDMLCFAFCKEQYSAPPQHTHTRDVFKGIWKNRPFRQLMLMWTAWCFTASLCEPYLGRYSMNEMGLSFTQLMIFGTTASSIATMLVMRRWGRALDAFGCRSVMMVASVAVSLVNAFYLFSTPGQVWPVFLRNFIGACFWSGTNLAANSMQLSASPDDARPTYVAVYSCVTALVGTAVGGLVGGSLLEFWQKQGWFSTGFLDRYKALILLAVILRLTLALALVPRLENDREGTPQDLLRAMVPRRLFARFHR